jgi:hypothetical protein
MIVTTKYCVISDTTIEFVTKVEDNNTSLEVNVLLPETSSASDIDISSASVLESVTVATDDSVLEPEYEPALPDPALPDSTLTSTIESEYEPALPDPANAVSESTDSLVAQPLGEMVLSAAPPITKKRRGLQAVIRGVYTMLFSLLGMIGAAFAYLKDNLNQLTDVKWQTVAIVVGGALLAGSLYGLKRWYKPEGLL